MLARRLPFWRGQLLAMGCLTGALLLRLLLQPLLDGRLPFITLFPALLIASIWGGPWAGLSVLLVGTPVIAYVWLPPVWSWNLTAPSFPILIAFILIGGLLIIVATLFRALNKSHRQQQERAMLLAQEMRHRVRNVLGLVMAISSQTARNASSIAEHQQLFSARIEALGRAQEFSAQDPGSPLELKPLLVNVVEPFGVERCRLQGPKVLVAPAICSSLALMIHELGTNAVKYGALSAPEGCVMITWTVEADRINLEWRETGGPPVQPPSRKGFGSRLIQAAFPAGQGETELLFAPEGVRCVMRF